MTGDKLNGMTGDKPNRSLDLGPGTTLSIYQHALTFPKELL
jgi:hypothetical protein